MNRKAWPVAAAVLLGVAAGLFPFRGEPAGEARAQAPAANDNKDRVPPDIRRGVKIVFDLPKHPFGGKGFEGYPVVEEVRGNWVRLSQKVNEEVAEEFNRKGATVWVNFDTVNWYAIVP
jgi:hypothetical protein